MSAFVLSSLRNGFVKMAKVYNYKINISRPTNCSGVPKSRTVFVNNDYEINFF